MRSRKPGGAKRRLWLPWALLVLALLALSHLALLRHLARPTRPRGGFQSLGALSLRASAASGLALLRVDSSTLLLAVPSFYGSTTPVYELSQKEPGPGAKVARSAADTCSARR